MINPNIESKFQMFSDKMILSTSKEDKKIFLWDENTSTILYTYEDTNMKSFIAKDKLITIGKDLFSEYILALQENKSLISIWKTNSSECAIKCSPIDERITSLDIIENNKLLLLSTETGRLFIYEVFSGNILSSEQISGSAIYQIKTCLKDGGLILVLSEDYLKLFKLENLLESGNNINSINAIYEFPNYEKLTKFLFLKEFNLVILYSDNHNKIAVHSFPKLQNLKNIYIENNDNSEITDICYNYHQLFIAYNTGKVFLVNINEILNNELSVVTLTPGVNIFPIIQSEGKISTFYIAKKHIIIGHEEGKVTLWDKYNFKQKNIFSQHKGTITNITCVNRPISQYGLNFNNSIEENTVKSFKKQSVGYNNLIPVKNSFKNEDFVENFLNKQISNYYDNQIISSGDNVKASVTNSKIIVNGINNSQAITNIKSNVVNMDDNKYLRKKLSDLYEILNNS
jgi:WD40 repeat protein